MFADRFFILDGERQNVFEKNSVVHAVDIKTEIIGVKLNGVEVALAQFVVRIQKNIFAVAILQANDSAESIRPLLQLAENTLRNLPVLALQKTIQSLVRNRQLFPLRERSPVFKLISLRERRVIAQLNDRRIFVVVRRRFSVQVAAPDSQKFFPVVETNSHRAFRAEVNRADAARFHVKFWVAHVPSLID